MQTLSGAGVSPSSSVCFRASDEIEHGYERTSGRRQDHEFIEVSRARLIAGIDRVKENVGFERCADRFGFEGEIMFDQEDPANSSVSVSMPVMSMLTGWEGRFEHFMSADFFAATEDEMVTFTSTGIEVTGENTALITGDLTLNGVTKSVVLDAKLNQASDHPMANQPWAGFDATTTLLRSDYNVGAFAPFVGDEVTVQISIEAMKAAE